MNFDNDETLSDCASSIRLFCRDDFEMVLILQFMQDEYVITLFIS